MKKVISVIMAVAILCVGLLPAASAATACNCSDVPVIYVRGKTPILPDKSKPASNSNHQIPYITGQELETYITELAGLYLMSPLIGYERMEQKLAEIFAEEYKDYALDKNGKITNNSGIAPEFQWSKSTVKDNHKPSKTVATYEQASAEIYKYYYIYDCRVDPFETADDLREYIKTVKSVTGHSKVKILARCYGTNVISAYFAKYGWSDIEDVVLYNPIMYGTDKLDCIFTGDIVVTQESIDYISENYIADTEEDQTLKLLVDVLNRTGGFDFTNSKASDAINYCSPAILRETYATCPGFWAMLSADSYEKAKDFIYETAYYGDEFTEAFAGIIKKTDNYHENVRLKLDEIYSKMRADGVDVYTIAKYGTQLLPIMEDPMVQADDTVSVTTQVPGTIAAPLGSTFGDAYMETAAANGTAKYISPDKVIDASGVAYRDTTWYVKNLAHDSFPKVFDLFIYKLLRAKGTFTINSDKNYPQFMVYENNDGTETVKPLKTADENDQPLDLLGDLLLFIQKIQAVIIKILREYLMGIVL